MLVPRPHAAVFLWGSLASCVPIVYRHPRRLAIAAQDTILPHWNILFLAVTGLVSIKMQLRTQNQHRWDEKEHSGPFRAPAAASVLQRQDHVTLLV